MELFFCGNFFFFFFFVHFFREVLEKLLAPKKKFRAKGFNGEKCACACVCVLSPQCILTGNRLRSRLVAVHEMLGVIVGD